MRMGKILSQKLGIIGGGQLGRMLIQAATNFNIITHVLDPDASAPCSTLAHRFYNGSLLDYNTVYQFGKQVDVITIEIENVNCEALIQLEKEGKTVYPQPKIIRLIQDKGLQKQYFDTHNIPSSAFKTLIDKTELHKHIDFLPFFMKLRKAGYDGKGVVKMNNETDFAKGFDAPSLIEKQVDVVEEIAVIVARNSDGQVKTFPAVGMSFHPEANLVEYLYAPCTLPEEVLQKANHLAIRIIESLGMVGLLAVEMFVDKNFQVWINELAPRAHNSGHHTIEANQVSQYEQLLRAIFNLPLANTALKSPAVMVNLLGENNHNGIAKIEGLESVLALPDVHVHLYGKTTTKPYRKMGHVTVLAPTLSKAIEKGMKVKNTLKITS